MDGWICCARLPPRWPCSSYHIRSTLTIEKVTQDDWSWCVGTHDKPAEPTGNNSKRRLTYTVLPPPTITAAVCKYVYQKKQDDNTLQVHSLCTAVTVRLRNDSLIDVYYVILGVDTGLFWWVRCKLSSVGKRKTAVFRPTFTSYVCVILRSTKYQTMP